MARLLPLVVCALAAGASAADHPLHGSLASIRVVGGFTPYRTVTYEVVWRGKTAVASHTRTFVNYEEVLQQMSLVEQPAWERLLSQLEAAGAWALPDGPRPGASLGALRYEVEVARGGKTHTFAVTDPPARADPRYRRVVGLVKRFVLARAGRIAFRNVFFEPGTFGFLNLTSVPAARVHIDGRDTTLETPLYGYELEAGDHELLLVDPKSRHERRHTVRVDRGMTTILHVELR